MQLKVLDKVGIPKQNDYQYTDEFNKKFKELDLIKKV